MKDMKKYHLRLNLESTCNFKCIYCNPDSKNVDKEILSVDEIKKILSAAYENKIERIHYTGGEPLLRKELPEIVECAKKIGFKEQVITTNGLLLSKKVDQLYDAGLSRVTISLDTLNHDKFKRITNIDGLHLVLDAVDKVLKKYDYLKMNIVAMKDNVDEVADFIKLSEKYNNKIILRFIELQKNQPVSYDNKNMIFDSFISHEKILEKLGDFEKTNIHGDNPNIFYVRLKSNGVKVGIINNESRGYPCGDCYKIRVSPYGDIGACINTESKLLKNLSEIELIECIKSIVDHREQLHLLDPDRKHFNKTYGFWRWGNLNEKELVTNGK